MSNKKPAAASDPHPFAVRAPFSEGSVYGPPTPERTCHVYAQYLCKMNVLVASAQTLRTSISPLNDPSSAKQGLKL
eukprot:358768-Chlamydomonas_euryale.AAC.2